MQNKNDTIYRQAAIDVVRKCPVREVTPAYMLINKAEVMTELMQLPPAQSKTCAYWDRESNFCALHRPSAQPTLYEYDINNLKTIAMVLKKENMPPERVMEALTDIGRIIAMAREEFEESLKEAVEQCMTQSTDRTRLMHLKKN